MAAINEAWSVLRDPVRRARYDADLRGGVDGGFEPRREPSVVASRPGFGEFGRARFPWRFVLSIVIVATGVIVAVGAFTDPGPPGPVDNLLQPGSCVDIDDRRREAFEVPCDGAHEAVVEELVPFDAKCGPGESAYRDHQGMGQVCVVESDR
jgi:curved DNA-binding protein CbpA